MKAWVDMDDKLHGYEIMGRNPDSGNYIGVKDGRTYEIHKHVVKLAKSTQGTFDSLVSQRKKIITALSKLSSGEGALLTPVDAFVDNKRYYEVALMPEEGLSVEDVGMLPFLKQLTIMADIAREIRTLHRAGICHGAICLENIHVLTYRNNHFSVKLSGFWHSGFYRDNGFAGVEITDLYGVGMAYGSYLSGYPLFDFEDVDLYKTFSDGYEPVFELDIDDQPVLSDIIKWLLWGFGQARPSADTLYRQLRTLIRENSVDSGSFLTLVK